MKLSRSDKIWLDLYGNEYTGIEIDDNVVNSTIIYLYLTNNKYLIYVCSKSKTCTFDFVKIIFENINDTS